MAFLETMIEHASALNVLAGILIVYFAYSITVAIYNVTLHPLAKYPGPLLRGAFYFPQYWELWTGDMCRTNMAFHDKYGSVVRISPTALSYNNAQAWQDIYNQRQGKKQIPKDPTIYINADGISDIIVSSDANHTRIRRLLSHGFSESALYEQESLQSIYFDLFAQRLHETITSPSKGKVNMVPWFNFATFDLIGDLVFGESFGALDKGEYVPWIANIVNGFKFARLMMIMRAYPIVGGPLLFLANHTPALHRQWKKHVAYTEDKTRRRLDAETDRHDIMSYILRHNDEKGMTEAEIMKNNGALILAGSETSSTMLAGLLYHLLLFPATLDKLTQEIRSTFAQTKDISFARLQGLTYLNACIREGFRIYPPTPMILPRRTVRGGAVIDRRYVPENTAVGVQQWSTTRSERNFYKANEFIPERWIDLGDERFLNDNKAALQPFSLGPRNCIGRHLAMAQMRSLLARLVWEFDIELCDESRDWLPQKVFLLWDKPDLMVKLCVRKD